jgi:hypothetical protein
MTGWGFGVPIARSRPHTSEASMTGDSQLLPEEPLEVLGTRLTEDGAVSEFLYIGGGLSGAGPYGASRRAEKCWSGWTFPTSGLRKIDPNRGA